MSTQMGEPTGAMIAEGRRALDLMMLDNSAPEEGCLVATIYKAMRALEARTPGNEAVLPCDVTLPPATVIRAGCKLSTLIHALELRGMEALSQLGNTDNG